METTENKRHQLEVADVVQVCLQELQSKYNLASNQVKALNDILRCRTKELGGHINCCNVCDFTKHSYNSCRNRHCPKCQYVKQQQWVDKLKGRLIPSEYFHIVFTIPEQLNTLFYINQEICYTLLMQSAWEALQNAGRNPKFLGADVGAVAVLHTWGQTLVYHPHVHMIVPAGGLSEDQMEWIPSSKKFFVPIKAISAMFRGILVRKLKKLIDKEQLKLPEEFINFETLKKSLYRKTWNVYSKKAFAAASSVLEYLGRYTHRVAISNTRLISMENGKVNFSYRDYRKSGRYFKMGLSSLEFVRRFSQHILPSGFYKIRYMGILATVHIHTKREQAITLVGKTMWLPILEGLSAYEVMREIKGKDPAICPVCKKGIMTLHKGTSLLE